MGNILSYNRRTNELVARNDSPQKIVKYIYQFTLHEVNFLHSYVYYIAPNWNISNDGTDLVFTYTGTVEGTTDVYYVLNLDVNNAIKIAQFSRLSDLSIATTNLDYLTKFTWVSKKSLLGVTLNEDEFDINDNTENVTRDYSLAFIGNDDYIVKRMVVYTPSLGEIRITNTNSNNLKFLHQLCIREVNVIGVDQYIYTNVQKEYDYLNPDWTLTTETSIKNTSYKDYIFTYKYGSYDFVSNGTDFLLLKFSQTLDQNSSNINLNTEVLAIEQPLSAPKTIRDKTIIDKIMVNTVISDGKPEIEYKLTPLNYFKGQSLIDYINNSWTTFKSFGLRYIELKGVNLSHECLLLKTGILNEQDWTLSTTVNEYDSSLFNIIMEYTGSDGGYGFIPLDGTLFILFKVLNRAIANSKSNINIITLVKLKMLISTDLTATSYDYEYETTGYYIDISSSQPNEYIGCSKMINYNPLSGLLKFNGTYAIDRIPSLKEFSLIDVNLHTDSGYDKLVSTWELSKDVQTTIGTNNGNDLTISNNQAVNSGYICKFYKVSNSTRGSDLNPNTVVKIALENIPYSGGTDTNGNEILLSDYAYLDLLSVTGTYLLSINEINELRLGNPICNSGDTYIGNNIREIVITFGMELFLNTFTLIDTTNWTASVVGKELTLVSNDINGYAHSSLGDNELLIGSFDSPMVVERITIKDSNSTLYYGNYIGNFSGPTVVEYWSHGTGYIEYDGGTAEFSVNPNAGTYALPSIKKFIIENINSNAGWVYDRHNGLSNWTISSTIIDTTSFVTRTLTDTTFNDTIDITEYDSNNITAEYNNTVLDLSNLSLQQVFLLTRTSVFGQPSKISDTTTITVYMNYNNIDNEENYFADVLASNDAQEYISNTALLTYSNYFGNLTINNNTILTDVTSITLLNVNVDSALSVYELYTLNNVTTVASHIPFNDAYDFTLDWGGTGVNINNGTEIVRLIRLGNNIVMNDSSTANIDENTVIHIVGKDKDGTSVDAYVSLLNTFDLQTREYYSKRNYINYHAEIGEVNLRRSIIDYIYAVELIDIDINSDDLHFVHPDWNVSHTSNNSGGFDLKLTYVGNGAEPYNFDSTVVDYDDVVRLFTVHGLASGFDLINTQIRLYIRNNFQEAITENTINKTGKENVLLNNTETIITDTSINYYMRTGSVQLKENNEIFRTLYKFVLQGVNVDSACIYSRTFINSAAWTVTTTPNFYNNNYVDLTVTYNDENNNYIVGDEVFLFQFFDTINRSIENSSLFESEALQNNADRTLKPLKETPVTWWYDKSSESNPYPYLTGYFINNSELSPYDQLEHEYFSENARAFKYYHNLGLTEITSQNIRIKNINSVTFLDVNFSVSQIDPSRTSTSISLSSIDAVQSNGNVYQDFTIQFQNPPFAIPQTAGIDQDGNEYATELTTVYDFYDVNIIDFMMNNDTIALVYDGNVQFPIRTLRAENVEYYKMDGIINYYSNNGDINFIKKSYPYEQNNSYDYNEGDGTTSVYKISMESVNATKNEVIITYGSWIAESIRIGSLYTLNFNYSNTSLDEDTFAPNEDFINIALLLGYYSSIYGSALINKDTIVTVTFKKDEVGKKDRIARGKLVRLLSEPTEYDVTFTDRTKYPVPTNLYTQYKEYNMLFLTGDARKTGTGTDNTFISVFDRFVMTSTTGIGVKTNETVFKANSSKVQIVRYTIIKSKTAPYNFICEESGYTSFDIDSTNPSMNLINIPIYPEKNIASNSNAIKLLTFNLNNENYTRYEVLDSIIVFIISSYNGKKISPQVRNIFNYYGANFGDLRSIGDCYMSVLFVNRKFETTTDLATISVINRSDFNLSQRTRTTTIYESTSTTKIVTTIPYAQMSTYMKYHYESIKNMGNTVRLPTMMMFNADQTLKNYRKNSIVYNVNILN